MGGRLDVVFVVPASTDRISLARPLRELLTSAAGSLNVIGARDSQVQLLKNKSPNRAWRGTRLLAHRGDFDYFLPFSGGSCSIRLQTQNMVPA